jgi:hypothetical protein
MCNDMFYLLVCYLSVISQCTDMEHTKLTINPILFLQLDRESVRGDKLSRSARLNSVGSLIFLLPGN